MVGDHVHGLGIGGGVAEGLHHQVGREAQTRQVLQLVSAGTKTDQLILLLLLLPLLNSYHYHGCSVGIKLFYCYYYYYNTTTTTSTTLSWEVARPGHGSGGVLRADRGHAGLTVLAGKDTLTFRQVARAGHHLLSQSEFRHLDTCMYICMTYYNKTRI